MSEAAVGHVLLARLAALRDRPEELAGLLADLRSVEHGNDPRFALTLDHYLESWLGDRPREVFRLPGPRVLILAPAAAAPLLAGGAGALARLLRSHGFGAMGVAAYDLPRDLERMIADLVPPAAIDRLRVAAAAERVPTAALDQVLAVERVLHGADLASLLREETLWAFGPDGPQPRLTELAVSLDELEGRLELSLRRDAWLRHEVASLLDRGVLRHVARDRSRGTEDYAFDLHTATVLDDGFAALARAVPVERRRRLTAELAAWELGLSADRFAAAAARLADLGLAVAIDHVPLAALATLDSGGVEPAYVKVLADGAPAGEVPALLRAGVERFGAQRLAVWRCETPALLEAGRAAGVCLFQGTAADAAAREEARTEAESPPHRSRPADGAPREEGGAEGGAEGEPPPRPGFLARLFGRLR
ncbi:hypothetical protein [Azospirillum halopraeferens]|uniref:hypothetical protein n=1 Tax=Azospirillum halopraeferens TaxID=34010 RepID=UPI00042822FC|nr:hypothetical protein [Azospirillum halopraeferens]